jgi:hypothetical protein
LELKNVFDAGLIVLGKFKIAAARSLSDLYMEAKSFIPLVAIYISFRDYWSLN